MTRLFYSSVVHLAILGVLLSLPAASPLPTEPVAKLRVTLIAPRLDPSPKLTPPPPRNVRPVSPPVLSRPAPESNSILPDTIADGAPTRKTAISPPADRLSSPKRFVPPAPKQRQAPASLVIRDTVLPELAVSSAPPRLEAATAHAMLPPRPIVVGGLSTASTAVDSNQPARATRSAGFSDTPSISESAHAQRGDARALQATAFAPVKTSASDGPPGRPITAGTGFGDAQVATSAAPPASTRAPAAFKPAEILSKPKPLYTEEARSLRIEGEVALEILFQANGEIKILRVLEGLGHGLDESAIESAKRIRFRPAQQDGRAVDQTATTRIVFRLAY